MRELIEFPPLFRMNLSMFFYTHEGLLFISSCQCLEYQGIRTLKYGGGFRLSLTKLKLKITISNLVEEVTSE
jgi:hypothetical protein